MQDREDRDIRNTWPPYAATRNDHRQWPELSGDWMDVWHRWRLHRPQHRHQPRPRRGYKVVLLGGQSHRLGRLPGATQASSFAVSATTPASLPTRWIGEDGYASWI